MFKVPTNPKKAKIKERKKELRICQCPGACNHAFNDDTQGGKLFFEIGPIKRGHHWLNDFLLVAKSCREFFWPIRRGHHWHNDSYWMQNPVGNVVGQSEEVIIGITIPIGCKILSEILLANQEEEKNGVV